MPNISELFKAYRTQLDLRAVQEDIQKILKAHYDANNTAEVYKKCLNCIDLTSLNGSDTKSEIVAMTEKVNNFKKYFPHLDNVAAICVYPSLVPMVKEHLSEEIGIAAVSACFPASQSFLEVKIAETAMTVLAGATEIDVVISIGKFLEEDYEEVYEELSEIKAACRDAHLKVILETGVLEHPEKIKKASLIAMAAGADFIKTSTGKVPVSATLEASYVMCHAIKEWKEKNNLKIGYKPAGGISTTEEAVKHYTLVKEILGEDWLNNKLFRFGASRLANNLLSSIEGKETKYF